MCLFKCLLLIGAVTVVAGVPLQQDGSDGSEELPQQTFPFLTSTPNNQDLTEQNNGEGSGIDLVSIKSISGMIEDVIAQTMVEQCNNRIDPAIQFYDCVSNTTNLPQVWMTMGLNATLLRIRTTDIITLKGANLTDHKVTSITLLDSNYMIKLPDLLRMINSQTANFCENIDGLLNCLDPYLDTCFPEPSTGNDVVMNQNRPMPVNDQGANQQQVQLIPASTVNPIQQTISTWAVPNLSGNSNETSVDLSSDVGANDTVVGTNTDQDQNTVVQTEQQEFFNIPMMTTQKQITYFIDQTLRLLCSDNAAEFKAAIDSIPCVMPTVGLQNCHQFDSAVDAIQDVMEQNNATGPNPDICGAMMNAAECHTDLVNEDCGQDAANLGRRIYQIYFDSISCMDAQGSNNVVSLRQPNNQMILGF